MYLYNLLYSKTPLKDLVLQETAYSIKKKKKRIKKKCRDSYLLLLHIIRHLIRTPLDTRSYFMVIWLSDSYVFLKLCVLPRLFAKYFLETGTVLVPSRVIWVVTIKND